LRSDIRRSRGALRLCIVPLSQAGTVSLMRLLFMNYEFPPVGGGAAYASRATARELVALGHEVDFLTTATDGNRDDEEIDGIRVHRVRSYRRGVHESGLIGALSFLGFAATRLRELARVNGYDAYHYYFSLPTGFLSLLPGAHRHRPYIVSLRGSDVPGYDPALFWHHKALLPITHRIWRNAYRVVANSADLRRLALRSAPDLSIDVILNGASEPAARSSPGEKRSGLRVLAVSRLIARKGLDTLIRTLARPGNEDLSLEIAGEGPEGAALRGLAHTCGVADRVRFHGFVNHAALASLYINADVFVLTSLAESCSMALLEAMAAGLPLVATRVGGNVELIRDGTNGLLFKAQSVEELGTALRMLASNPALRGRFAAVNRELAREQFSWRAVARRYEAIFRQATGQCAPDGNSERAPVQAPIQCGSLAEK
jgi:glycosyltransferase involved in cell wall biosynthesis